MYKQLTSEQRSQIFAYLQDGIARKIICKFNQAIFVAIFHRLLGYINSVIDSAFIKQHAVVQIDAII
ncbi:MAG: hypothetical protein SOU27_01385 [Sodaliphilus sp.]|nr:hypothetical protein [Sodaliphilus sp.]